MNLLRLAFLLILPSLSAAPIKVAAIGDWAGQKSVIKLQKGDYLIADDSGGKNNAGTLKLLHNGKVQTFFQFNGYNGSNPTTLVKKGNQIYGITQTGGLHNYGVLFRVKGKHVHILYHFENSPDMLVNQTGRIICKTSHAVFEVSNQKVNTLLVAHSIEGLLVLPSSILYTQSGLDAINTVTNNGTTTLPLETPGEFLPRNTKSFWVVAAYGGTYGYGYIAKLAIDGTVLSTFQLQSYNGGHPREATTTPSGQLFFLNEDGVWSFDTLPSLVVKNPEIKSFGISRKTLYFTTSIALSKTLLWETKL
jgi:hypothetical protein